MNILNEIIALDKKASAYAEAEINSEKMRSEQLDGDLAKARREKIESEREKIAQQRQQQLSALSEKLSGAEKEQNRLKKEVSDIFSAKKEKWKNEIISRITEG